jgi:hypothetical protein
VKTVILLDSTKVALSTLVSGVTLLSKLAAFAARSEIGGAIVDVNLDRRVKRAQGPGGRAQDCPYATNLVAEEIKTIVDSYRTNNPGLRYVVIVGNDSTIPFFRYPDETLIGQGIGIRPTGRECDHLRCEPEPGLRAEPGCLRRQDPDLDALHRVPGAGSGGRSSRRDTRRDRRVDRCLHGGQRRHRSDVVACHGL